jgi:hypothetical protein
VYISDLHADDEKVRIAISRIHSVSGVTAKFDSSMRLCISDMLNQGRIRCNDLPPSVEEMDDSSRLVIDYPISAPFASSVFALHIWLADKHQSAVICGSGIYIPVDVRLPNYGFGVLKEAVGLNLRAEICTTSSSTQLSESTTIPINESTINSSVLDSGVMCSRTKKSAAEVVHVFTAEQAQAVSGDHAGAPGHEKDVDTFGLCGGHEEYQPVSLHMTDISSLQLFHADFCAAHAFADASCAHIALELAAAAHKAVLSRSLGLPSVQYVPSPEDPFIFLHMEKTAGSAIRE